MNKKQIVIQIFANDELKSRFEEAFQQSQCNTKGEFLGNLITGSDNNRNIDVTSYEDQILRLTEALNKQTEKCKKKKKELKELRSEMEMAVEKLERYFESQKH